MQRVPLTHPDVIHLCDLLAEAEVDAPRPGMVDLQYMEVDGDYQMTVFQHPDSRVRIPLAAPSGGALRFGQGIKSSAWDRVQGPVTFRAGADVGGSIKWLHKTTVDARRPAGRGWLQVEVAVPSGTTAIILETSVRRQRSAYAWAGWADPTFAPNDAPPVTTRPRRPAHPSLLLITSDACRADLLGCYGNDEIATPALDALAADGLRFTDARTNSSTTTGSYATALTGTYPTRHGMLAEWGTLNAELPNLMTIAGAAGFHTVFAASELEIAAPPQGFGRDFDAVIPCVANPSQDGRVTTRGFLRWLDDRPDQPFLAWVGYYDTHPPLRLAASVSQAFYEGDPRDPARTFKPEMVETMRGVEGLLELGTLLPLLQAGRVSGHAWARLSDTARALAGEIESGPDLATHLASLGPSACNGMSRADFAVWLGDQSALLHDGVVEPELLAWIEDLLPRLRDIEIDIMAGLRGVVDFRYVLAQARASVVHLDAQVAALVDRLRQEDLYDECTIVFMSGHGELYGECGECGHHQSLLEPVLHTPLIIKPARSTGIEPGVVAGPFETIDLLPTLLDLLGLETPATDGRSRRPEMTGPRVIEDRDVFSVDSHAWTVSVRRGAHKLVLYRTWTVRGGEAVAPNTAQLYRVEGDTETMIDDADVATALESRLRAWLDGAALPEPPASSRS